MTIQELVPIGSKTTMRIGGKAQYYAEVHTKEELEECIAFAEKQGVPFLLLGSGANTIFCDTIVHALVVRIKNDTTQVEGECIRVGGGKNLAMLINELASQGLDLSPLTGIPGTVGGAIFGNAGQGPSGTWIDSFVENVLVFVGGAWKTFSKKECGFGYRESAFKHWASDKNTWLHMPAIWETVLRIPRADPATIHAKIVQLLNVRIETQPHLKTAGSCFKAVGGTPAWKLIDAAGLRGVQIGGVQIAEKHANFLLNKGNATYADAKAVVEKVKASVAEPLDVEMRFIEADGRLAF